MRDETAEHPAPLRSGLTTGSCATATSLAAARLLLDGTSVDAVEIVLPKGKQDASWVNDDELLVGREWKPGQLTKSGYAYVVKSLMRGQPLSSG